MSIFVIAELIFQRMSIAVLCDKDVHFFKKLHDWLKLSFEWGTRCVICCRDACTQSLNKRSDANVKRETLGIEINHVSGSSNWPLESTLTASFPLAIRDLFARDPRVPIISVLWFLLHFSRCSQYFLIFLDSNWILELSTWSIFISEKSLSKKRLNSNRVPDLIRQRTF